jgi:hypothetical protein
MFRRFATRRHEARFPTLWEGVAVALCPSITGPTGDTLYDLSGRNRNGTLTGMDAATDWTRHTGAYALDLDGSNDQIAIADPAGIPSYAMSFSIWLRTTTDSAFQLFSITAPSTAKVGTIWLGNAVTGTMSNEIITLETSIGSSTIRGYTSADRTFFNGFWRHVCCVFNGTSSVMYVDGVRRTTTVGGGQTDNGRFWDTSATATKCRIGSVDYGSGDSYFAPMTWDDARVYNRPLDDGEARLLSIRRGIAYEPRRDILFGSTANRRRRLLTGMV